MAMHMIEISFVRFLIRKRYGAPAFEQCGWYTFPPAMQPSCTPSGDGGVSYLYMGGDKHELFV